MPLLNVGSTLSDLGRNALLSAELDQRERETVSNQLLQNRLATQAERESQQDRAVRRDALNMENQYRNNLLAQQDRQWITPNATSVSGHQVQERIARYPWDLGMTPAQAAAFKLQREQLEAAKTNPGLNDPKLRSQVFQDAINQRATRQRAEQAANVANSITETQLPQIRNQLIGNLDAGQNWIPGTGYFRGDALAVADQMFTPNPTNNLMFSATGKTPVLGGKSQADDWSYQHASGNFNTALNNLARDVGTSLGKDFGLVELDKSTMRWKPSSTLSASGMQFISPHRKPLDRETAEALLDEADGDKAKAEQLAISRGYDL